jgi:3-oxoacyl-[acyl-carrier protein] reductase
MATKPLEGRNAIVTGAARGIGRAIAERLALEGARVAILDINGDAARATAAEIGCEVGLLVDVADAAQVDGAIASLIEDWDCIDILVNNAGIVGTDTPVAELEESDWDRVLDINLKGTFLCSRAVIPSMVSRKRGVIVSLSSISAKEGNANMAPYSVSKAGILCFTKALAKEVMADGIRVNCVAPALIDSPLLDGMEPDRVEFLISKIPMGRLGRMEEVAATVFFLASDEASFTTGQCFDVSGGRANY